MKTFKYKLITLRNGKGDTIYEVKRKSLFLYFYLVREHWTCGGTVFTKSRKEFSTRDEAMKEIEKDATWLATRKERKKKKDAELKKYLEENTFKIVVSENIEISR